MLRAIDRVRNRSSRRGTFIGRWFRAIYAELEIRLGKPRVRLPKSPHIAHVADRSTSQLHIDAFPIHNERP
jgi:hypothetical protein